MLFGVSHNLLVSLTAANPVKPTFRKSHFYRIYRIRHDLHDGSEDHVSL
jgi:hypothetical protein